MLNKSARGVVARLVLIRIRLVTGNRSFDPKMIRVLVKISCSQGLSVLTNLQLT